MFSLVTPYLVYRFLWFFVLYSIAGWVVEVAYHAVTMGKVINRGFLCGPVCPVYGFGAALMLALPRLFGTTVESMNSFLLFLLGMGLATLVELLAGVLLYVFFHARWWDYSNLPFNFHGFICLKFSIYWGLGILLAFRIVHPFLASCTVDFLPLRLGVVLIALALVIYLIDFIVTVAVIQGLNKKLERIEALRLSYLRVSDRMSVKIGEDTLRTTAKIENARVQASLAKAELRDSIASRTDSALPAADSGTDILDIVTYELEKAADDLRYTELKQRLQTEIDAELAKFGGSFLKNTLGSRRILKAFPHLHNEKTPKALQSLRDHFRN